MSKTLLLIVNPKAGKRRSREFFFDVFSLFSEAGYLISLRQTQGPGDAVRIAAEEAAGFDLVVCCGGDGTLNQVVNGLLTLSDPPPLGYIAGGSTNDFAATLQLPADPVETARVILDSGVGALDVGQFNQRMFMYVASFGAFTKVANTFGATVAFVAASAVMVFIKYGPYSADVSIWSYSIISIAVSLVVGIPASMIWRAVKGDKSVPAPNTTIYKN